MFKDGFNKTVLKIKYSKTIFFWNFSPHSHAPPYSDAQSSMLFVHHFFVTSLKKSLSPLPKWGTSKEHSIPIPTLEKAKCSDLLCALEASIGYPFSSEPLTPNPNFLIIVINNSSDIGKDTLIVHLYDSRLI